MKLRRLDREYNEVLKAEIKIDANKYEGLEKILQKEIAEIRNGRKPEEVEKKENKE